MSLKGRVPKFGRRHEVYPGSHVGIQGMGGIAGSGGYSGQRNQSHETLMHQREHMRSRLLSFEEKNKS